MPDLQWLSARWRTLSDRLRGAGQWHRRAIASMRWPQLTLRTRILTVLILVASASTVISILLQDKSLERDLEFATRARLQRARGTVSQLLANHLVAQQKRYRTVISTPQFAANLESKHAATLRHFTAEILAVQDATAVLILDNANEEVAGSGGNRIRAAIRERLRKPAGQVPVPTNRASAGTMVYDGAPLSMVRIPLEVEGKPMGSLVAVEPITKELLQSWSRLSRAEVSTEEPDDDDPMVLTVLGTRGLPLFVRASFHIEQQMLENSRKNLVTGGLLGVGLALLASVFLARSLVSPIRRIQSGIARIGAGEHGFRFHSDRRDEVGDVARGLDEMLDRLEASRAVHIEDQDKISRLSYHDTLTGLGNRRLLTERLGAALDEHPGHVAVIFMDLDRFKTINDALGHTAGDELLVEVAKRLDSCLRLIHGPGDGHEEIAFLARLGGDEFTMMLSDVEDRRELEALAEHILESLSAPFDLRGEQISLSASLGIAMSPDGSTDVETLLRNSDLAMFHAKNRGGKGYEFYSHTLHETATRRLTLDRRLQRAIDDEEFELLYQPKVKVRTGETTGFEALIRWQDSEQGTVGPGEFIAFAEETRAIIPIGKWAMRRAVEQSLEWQRQGLPPVRIAVNVSARQIDDRNDFAMTIAHLLADTGLNPKLLELEITETALLGGEESVIELLDSLRNLGVGLSLDDFGTGYSSLSYLRRLPVDTLKIDRSFIDGAEESPDRIGMLESIVKMGKVLNLKVVAEGIENEGQRKVLAYLGCDEFQGFLFSRPLTADDAAEWLRTHAPRQPSGSR